jgi:hypothetical protein
MWDERRRFANQSLGWCGIFCLNRFTKKARTERDDGRSDGRLKEAAFCRGVWLQAFWTLQIW